MWRPSNPTPARCAGSTRPPVRRRRLPERADRPPAGLTVRTSIDATVPPSPSRCRVPGDPPAPDAPGRGRVPAWLEPPHPPHLADANPDLRARIYARRRTRRNRPRSPSGAPARALHAGPPPAASTPHGRRGPAQPRRGAVTLSNWLRSTVRGPRQRPGGVDPSAASAPPDRVQGRVRCSTADVARLARLPVIVRRLDLG